MEKGTPMRFVLKGSFRPFCQLVMRPFGFGCFFGYLIKLGLATGFNLVPRLAQIGKTWTGLIKHGLINFSHSPRRDNDKKSFYSRFHGRVIRLFLF